MVQLYILCTVCNYAAFYCDLNHIVQLSIETSLYIILLACYFQVDNIPVLCCQPIINLNWLEGCKEMKNNNIVTSWASLSVLLAVYANQTITRFRMYEIEYKHCHNALYK